MSEARRKTALGLLAAGQARRLLSSLVHPLAPHVEQLVLEDEEDAREDALRHIRTITGANLPIADFSHVANPVTFVDGVEQPITPAPFLVLKVDWLNDGTDVGYFSEADLATSKYQLYGKITAISPFERAFGVDHGVQRSQITIRLEDIDRVFATRVRTGDYLKARFALLVGSPYLLPHQYTSIAAKYRVLQLGEIAEAEVEFTLIDAAEDLTGTISPPQVGDLGTFNCRPPLNKPSSQWHANRRDIDSLAKSAPARPSDTARPITIPFGRSIYKAPFAWSRVPDDTVPREEYNPQAVVILGCSKNPDWMRPHYYGNAPNVITGDTTNPAHGIEPIIYAGTPGIDDNKFMATKPFASKYTLVPWSQRGIVAYIDVQARQSSFEPDDSDPWYIAVLYVLYYGDGSGDGGGAHAKHALGRLRSAIQNDDVWIDIQGYGAAGQGGYADYEEASQPSFGDKPVDVIKYLARWHTSTGAYALSGASRLIESTDDALTAEEMKEPVGGYIEAEADGQAVANSLCSTFRMDIGVSARGRLILRPEGMTRDDRYLRVPTARTFTDNEHILEGSWQEIAPKGSDRWGFATQFKWDGIGPVLDGTTEFEQGRMYRSPATYAYGQEIERTINIEWRRRALYDTAAQRENWVLPYTVPRFGARFQVPVAHVLGLELGDFLFVTHYAGTNEDGTKGWDRRLCRIDAIGIDWEQRTGSLTVMDWQQDYDALPWVLDDEDYWAVAKPAALAAVTMTASSATVTFPASIPVKASWEGLHFQIFRSYNPRPWPSTDQTTYDVTESQCGSWEITGTNTGANTITIDSTYGENLTVYAWRVVRNHVDPPTSTTDPYHYPNDADIYGRLCDETAVDSNGATGAFSNSDPAYRLG